MGSNDWDLMAGMALEQILERNENGNLYPLTSLEIQVLTDIKNMIAPDTPEDEPAQVNGQEKPMETPTVQPTKGAPKKTPEAPVKKQREFKALDHKDLTG